MFSVLLMGDPAGFERAQSADSGAASPRGPPSVVRSDDVGVQMAELAGESFGKACEQSAAAGQYDVVGEVAPHFLMNGHDRFFREHVHAAIFDGRLDDVWLEQSLRNLVSDVADVDREFIAIGQFNGQVCIALLARSGVNSAASLLDLVSYTQLVAHIEVINVNAILFVDASLSVLRDGLTADLVRSDGVRNGEALVDGHTVGATVTRVDNDAASATSLVQ